jgi:hypothetical protein
VTDPTPKQRFVDKFCAEYELNHQEFDAKYSTIPGKVRLDTGEVVQWQIVRCVDLLQVTTHRVCSSDRLPGVRLLSYNVHGINPLVYCDLTNWPYSTDPSSCCGC